jgi:mannose-6-phosphate isomerase-like protein (cupin superfamily)
MPVESKGVARVVSAGRAREFCEGPERCLEYLRSAHLWFGTSTLQPGEEGAVDTGHEKSTEVFYCAVGRVEVWDGTEAHVLEEHDALIIPPGVPHTLRNTGSVTALVVWAGAPGEMP